MAWEFITHGGYDAAVSAWREVSLIFSSDDYRALLGVAFIFGVFVLFTSLTLKSILGTRVSFQTFIPQILIVGLVYGAFILPKDKIIVYDETLNRGPYEVDNIPTLIAVTAGMLNKVENGFIEMVATASDPVADYRYDPGGIGFKSLGMGSASATPPYYVYNTLYNYYKDCIVLQAGINEEYHPDQFTFDDIKSGKVSFVEAAEGSRNPSLYTVAYDTTGHSHTVSCREAYDNYVKVYLQDWNTFDSGMKAGCSLAGYDPKSIASYNQCKNLAENVFNWIAEKADLPQAEGEGLIYVMQQTLFAKIIKDYALRKGPAALGVYMAALKTQSSLVGLGAHANEWIPALKETLKAVVIALTPIVLMFLVTPIGGRALSLFFGMFVWLGMWSVIDAVITSFGLEMAAHTAKELAGPYHLGFGTFAASMFPGYTERIYAIFGGLRFAGLTLASVMSGMLVRYGGTAVAMLAGQLTGKMAAAGAAMGEAMAQSPLTTMEDMIIPNVTIANEAYRLGGVQEHLKAREIDMLKRIGLLQQEKTHGLNDMIAMESWKFEKERATMARDERVAAEEKQSLGGYLYDRAFSRVGDDRLSLRAGKYRTEYFENHPDHLDKAATAAAYGDIVKHLRGSYIYSTEYAQGNLDAIATYTGYDRISNMENISAVKSDVTGVVYTFNKDDLTAVISNKDLITKEFSSGISTAVGNKISSMFSRSSGARFALAAKGLDYLDANEKEAVNKEYAEKLRTDIKKFLTTVRGLKDEDADKIVRSLNVKDVLTLGKGISELLIGGGLFLAGAEPAAVASLSVGAKDIWHFIKKLGKKIQTRSESSRTKELVDQYKEEVDINRDLEQAEKAIIGKAYQHGFKTDDMAEVLNEGGFKKEAQKLKEWNERYHVDEVLKGNAVLSALSNVAAAVYRGTHSDFEAAATADRFKIGLQELLSQGKVEEASQLIDVYSNLSLNNIEGEDLEGIYRKIINDFEKLGVKVQEMENKAYSRIYSTTTGADRIGGEVDSNIERIGGQVDRGVVDSQKAMREKGGIIQRETESVRQGTMPGAVFRSPIPLLRATYHAEHQLPAGNIRVLPPGMDKTIEGRTAVYGRNILAGGGIKGDTYIQTTGHYQPFGEKQMVDRYLNKHDFRIDIDDDVR